MSTVELPEICDKMAGTGLVYGVVVNKKTGDLGIAAPGGFVSLPLSEAAHLARMLADHCTDPEERAMVRDEWSDEWFDDTEATR